MSDSWFERITGGPRIENGSGSAASWSLVTGREALILVAKERTADRVCLLKLRSPDGGRLPDWTPGSHIDLFLPNGLIRQYSLCGDRWDPDSYTIAVLLEEGSRGGSSFVHHSLQVGQVLRYGGPRNLFPLYPSGHYLFIAGGIGITPLIPMMQAVTMLEVPWRLVYGGRSRGSMAFSDFLVDRYGSRVELWPQDERGPIELDAQLCDAPEIGVVYCCGPPSLLAALIERTSARPPNAVNIERFKAGPLCEPVRDEPFEVHLSRSGVTVVVEVNESILDVLKRAKIGVLSSCNQGLCGTCESMVVDGLPDHRDSVLDDEERAANTSMMVCVSRSFSDRLVLDL